MNSESDSGVGSVRTTGTEGDSAIESGKESIKKPQVKTISAKGNHHFIFEVIQGHLRSLKWNEPFKEKPRISNFRHELDMLSPWNDCHCSKTGPSGVIRSPFKMNSRPNFQEILIQVRSLLKPGILHKLPYGTLRNVTLLL